MVLRHQTKGSASSLRRRLLLALVPILVLIFVTVSIVSAHFAETGLENLAARNIELSSENLKRSIERAFNETSADGVTAVRLDICAEAIESGDPKNFVLYVNELARAKQRYRAIIAVDDLGEIIGSSSIAGKEVELRGRKLGDEKWLKKIIASKPGLAHWTPPARPEVLKDVLAPEERVLGVGLPVTDLMDDNIGAFILFVSVDAIAGQFDDFSDEDNLKQVSLTALITDSEGKAVITAPSLSKKGWSSVRLPAMAKTQVQWRGPKGQSFAAVRSSIEGPGKKWGWSFWSLRTHAPIAKQLAGLHNVLVWTSVVGLLLLVLVLVLVSGRITAPIRRLTERTAAIHQATEFEPMPVESDDEVGTLTETFNRTLTELMDIQTSLEDQVAARTQQIEEHNRTLESRIEVRTEELRATQTELSEMLNNMDHAVVTFDSDLLVNPEHSAPVLNVFGLRESPTGRDALDFFFSNSSISDQDLDKIRYALSLCFGEGELQWLMNEDLLPTEFQRRIHNEMRDLRMGMYPIYDDQGALRRVLVSAEDVTALKKLERATEEKNEALAKLGELIAVDGQLFGVFLSEIRIMFADCRALLDAVECGASTIKESIPELFRHAHTIKGNARLFKLTAIQDCAHALEDTLMAIREGKAAPEDYPPSEIKKQIDFIETEVESYRLLREDLLGSHGDQNNSALSDTQQGWMLSVVARVQQMLRTRPWQTAVTGDLLRDLESAIAAIGKVQVQDYSERYDTMLQELAPRLGKGFLPIKIDGVPLALSATVMSRVNDMLIHCVRNAADHGIETPEIRSSAGKGEDGQISISVRQTGATSIIDISDDGSGIDTDKVVRSAIEKGLVNETEAAALDEHGRLNLVLRSGVSTALKVTDLSGRGVGLDAVYGAALDLGGDVSVQTVPGQGTTVQLRVPTEGGTRTPARSLFSPRGVIEQAIETTRRLGAGRPIELTAGEAPEGCVFGDAGSTATAIQILLSTLANTMPNGIPLDLHFSRKGAGGNRRYMLSIPVDTATSTTLRHDGHSLMDDVRRALLRSGGDLEINNDCVTLELPTNLPDAFFAAPLQVVLAVEDTTRHRPTIQRFAHDFLAGWSCEVHDLQDPETMERIQDFPAIVLVDPEHADKVDQSLTRRLSTEFLYVVKDRLDLKTAASLALQNHPIVVVEAEEGTDLEHCLEMAVTRIVYRGRCGDVERASRGWSTPPSAIDEAPTSTERKAG